MGASAGAGKGRMNPPYCGARRRVDRWRTEHVGRVNRLFRLVDGPSLSRRNHVPPNRRKKRLVAMLPPVDRHQGPAHGHVVREGEVGDEMGGSFQLSEVVRDFVQHDQHVDVGPGAIVTARHGAVQEEAPQAVAIRGFETFPEAGEEVP